MKTRNEQHFLTAQIITHQKPISIRLISSTEVDLLFSTSCISKTFGDILWAVLQNKSVRMVKAGVFSHTSSENRTALILWELSARQTLQQRCFPRSVSQASQQPGAKSRDKRRTACWTARNSDVRNLSSTATQDFLPLLNLFQHCLLPSCRRRWWLYFNFVCRIPIPTYEIQSLGHHTNEKDTVRLEGQKVKYLS